MGRKQHRQWAREAVPVFTEAAESARTRIESCEADFEWASGWAEDARRNGEDEFALALDDLASEDREQADEAKQDLVTFERGREYAHVYSDDFASVLVPGVGIPRSRSRCSTRSRERRSTRSSARSGDSGDDDGDGEHEPAAHRAGGAS